MFKTSNLNYHVQQQSTIEVLSFLRLYNSSNVGTFMISPFSIIVSNYAQTIYIIVLHIANCYN